MSDLETRSFTVRADDAAERTFSGIAVPWDTPVDIAGLYRETFEPGSVSLPASGRVLVYWRHEEPIGVVTAERSAKSGWEITGKLSDTPRGNEAYTLLRDGVLDELSIGFLPIEHREDSQTGDITRTRVEVREVSIVPFGAYSRGAVITDVRAASVTDAASAAERASMPDTDNTAAEVSELRGIIEEIDRKVTSISTRDRDDAPAIDTRSAGEALKLIARGDEAATRLYTETQERAYTGGTTADAYTANGWVGDLSRIFDSTSGTLANFFVTGTLPAEGMNVEFAEVTANTVAVGKQAAQGDAPVFGKVTIATRTAPVATYAGATELTIQEIDRTSVNVLNTSLNALAIGAAQRRKAELRGAYGTAVAAREAIASNGGVVVLGATLAAATSANWKTALVDSVVKLNQQSGLPIEAMIVSPSVFKKFLTLTEAGQVSFDVSGDGKTVGTLSLPGLKGNLGGITVVCDLDETTDRAVVANSLALRQYNSSLVSIQQDRSLISLSRAFGVYSYGANAAEIPGALVPIKLAAS